MGGLAGGRPLQALRLALTRGGAAPSRVRDGEAHHGHKENPKSPRRARERPGGNPGRGQTAKGRETATRPADGANTRQRGTDTARKPRAQRRDQTVRHGPSYVLAATAYQRAEVATMAKKKARRQKKARSLVVLHMILACKAKTWDARERRAKDARRKREEMGE